MKKEKIKWEYMLKAGSCNIAWSFIGTPAGLETWFADKVTTENKFFTFQWGKTETRQAEQTGCRANSYIRFHWLDDEDKRSYFELRVSYNELTEDMMLTITDWAVPGEEEEQKDLWDSCVEKLKRVSGL